MTHVWKYLRYMRPFPLQKLPARHIATGPVSHSAGTSEAQPKVSEPEKLLLQPNAAPLYRCNIPGDCLQPNASHLAAAMDALPPSLRDSPGSIGETSIASVVSSAAQQVTLHFFQKFSSNFSRLFPVTLKDKKGSSNKHDDNT